MIGNCSAYESGGRRFESFRARHSRTKERTADAVLSGPLQYNYFSEGASARPAEMRLKIRVVGTQKMF